MTKFYHVYSKTHYNLKFKILFEEEPVTIASAQQQHIYNIQIYIYFLKRKFTENVLQNTQSCTIDKKSGEYAPIPLNIMCVVIYYLLFFYNNKYFYNFFLQNKIFSKTHQIALDKHCCSYMLMIN